MKRIIRYLFLIALCPFLWGCNQEDDVFEIFDSGVWNAENYFTGVNWSTNSADWGKPVYTSKSDIDLIRQISIAFDEDGTFSGKLSGGGNFSGRWQADPSDRSFTVIGRITTSIKPTGKNAEFIRTLEQARYYRGDSKSALRLAPESKTNCILFTHRK